jgi:hypothetical protein
MKFARILIMVTMGFIVFGMVSCPAIYDSVRMSKAQRHYRDSPTEDTAKEVERAELDNERNILEMEGVSVLFVVFLVFIFCKIGKKPN